MSQSRDSVAGGRLGDLFGSAEARLASLGARDGPVVDAVFIAAWVYLALAVALWAWLIGSGGFEEGRVFLTYGPRWVVAVPALGIGCLARRRLSALAPVALTLMMVAGPLMGFTWASPRADAIEGQPLRLMTANVGSRRLEPAALAAVVARVKPDVVVVQECSERADLAFADPVWHYRDDDALCVASRYPLARIAARYRPVKPADDAFAVRYSVTTPQGRFDLVNVHLDTPRDGIDALLSGWQGVAGLRASINHRLDQSESVRRWLQDADTASLLVAGDFNLTVESAIYRDAWADLGNAFSAAGRGWGFTKWERGVFGARIDHVLIGRRWQARRSWIESSVGSDHRPLVADLILAP